MSATYASLAESRPTVACRACREQKLRCDRGLPSCQRCTNQQNVCEYPPPPDRRRIARESNRVRSSAARCGSATDRQPHLDHQQAQAQTHQAPTQPNDRTHVHMSRRPIVATVNTPVATAPDSDGASNDLPPKEIGRILFDVYFDRIHNATLLFHRNIALQLYEQGAVPDYLLRAIFAQAAIFFQPVEPPHTQHIKSFPLAAIAQRSWSWARSASRQVLSHADEPSIHRIQALQVLQLFYFSQGDRERAVVHAALAFQLTQLLGYHNLLDDAASFSLFSQTVRFDREMRRRIFWSSWCTMCLSGAPPLSTANVSNLPMPAIFEPGGSVQGVTVQSLGPTLALRANVPAICLTHASTGPSSHSLMAEMVLLMKIWLDVHQFISSAATCFTYAERESRVADIEESLATIEHSMRLSMDDIDAQAYRYGESTELFVSISSVFYLLKLLLHASMVPIFSRNVSYTSTEHLLIHNHADAVLGQSRKISELFTHLLARDLDVAKLWPCSGYAAYVAGSVFLIYAGFVTSSLPANRPWQAPGAASKDFQAVQTVLDVLAVYWEPLRNSAALLKRAVDTGVFDDPECITTCTYPWELRNHSHRAHSDGASRDSTSAVHVTSAPQDTYLAAQADSHNTDSQLFPTAMPITQELSPASWTIAKETWLEIADSAPPWPMGFDNDLAMGDTQLTQEPSWSKDSPTEAGMTSEMTSWNFSPLLRQNVDAYCTTRA